MSSCKLAAALVVACASAPALAADTWVGTANYGVETIGPFNTYDFSSAGALLLDPTSANTANGYYQSFVAQHMLDNLLVSSSKLNANYEITVVANFASTGSMPDATTKKFSVDSGSFALYLDTAGTDHNFDTDSGFTNGIKIMEGSILGGAGSTVSFFGMEFGGGGLQLKVTGYDTSVFNPATIGGGDSIFSLRLNAPTDSAFLNQIESIQGHSYIAASGDLKYAADGNLVLTPVPEPERYGMLLAGLGVIGAIARRRISR